MCAIKHPRHLPDRQTVTGTIKFLGSPVFFLLVTVVTIFITEFSIMILLWYLPTLKPLEQALIDASLLSMIVFPTLYFSVLRPLRLHIRHRQQAEQEKDTLIAELRNTLDEVKTLQGIIPICASCKKIRDDKGYWHQVEAYVSTHSNALFSHGLCPDCLERLYPDLKRS